MRVPLLITFLSDYGVDDVFVGLCHGVIATIAPSARVIDLSHAVPPQDVLTGACRLQDCVRHLPPAVHLAVVDPGVGTARRGVVVRAGRTPQPSWLVGPDNGLLMAAAEELGGPDAAWELPVPDSAPATFHGRDVFAPAAARLAIGVGADDLGARLHPAALVRLPPPPLDLERDALVTAVRDIDGFGNVQLFARWDDIAGLADHRGGWDGDRERQGPVLDVELGGERVSARVVPTFGALQPGTLGLIVDSFGWLALVVGSGNAARRLGVGRRDKVRLSRRQT